MDRLDRALCQVLPGLLLARTVCGDYALVQVPVDLGLECPIEDLSPLVCWTADLKEDPFAGMSDAEIDEAPVEMRNVFGGYMTRVENFIQACQTQVRLSTAYTIGKEAELLGYNIEKDGYLEFWLYDRMVALLKEAGC